MSLDLEDIERINKQLDEEYKEKLNSYKFEYDIFKRIVYLIYYSIVFFLSILFISIASNIFFKLVFGFSTLFSFFNIVGALLFKSFEILDSGVSFKCFVFKDEMISNDNLELQVWKGIWLGGGIFFIKHKKKPIKSFILMNLSLFPLIYKSLEDIRGKFIDMKLNVGNEKFWNYK